MYEFCAFFVCIEWHRVLKNGGILMVAVPDMHTLARYDCIRYSAQRITHSLCFLL